MDFFITIRNKLRFYGILISIPIFTVATICIIAIFSSELTFENRSMGAVLFLYGSVLLVSAFLIAVGVFLILLALKDDKYKDIMSQAEALGDLETIGGLLKKNKRTDLAVGNLYCTDKVLFYYCSRGGFALNPSDIKSLCGLDNIKKTRNHLYYKEFFVDIVLNEGENRRIYVKERNMLPLIDYLTKFYGIENRN